MKAIILSLIIFSALSIPSSAQMIGTLEDDSKVIKRRMENGLTYYLVKNPTIKDYADFTIALRTEHSASEPLSRVMTPLMECMSLTETANFPNGEIFTFFDNMGVDKKDELIVNGNLSGITFSCRNVPLKKNPLVVDSMLLALYNISSAVVIDEESVERGKAFLKNIFAGLQSSDRRANDSLMRVLYAGTPYAPVPPEELFRVADGLSVEEIRGYYARQCRPDLMAVIISGDIDPGEIETKIKSLFQVVPKPRVPLSSGTGTMPSPAEGRYITMTDKEADRAVISFLYYGALTPEGLRNTAFPLVSRHYTTVSKNIVRRRLLDRVAEQDLFLHSLEVSTPPFHGGQALKVSIECAPDDYTAGYLFLASELTRLSEEGALKEEIAMATSEARREIDNLYGMRNSSDNRYYTEICLRNFTENFTISGIEYYKSYIESVEKRGDTLSINNFLRALISDTLHRAVTAVSPIAAERIDTLKIPRLEPFREIALCDPDTASLEREKKIAKPKAKWMSTNIVDKKIGTVTKILPNGIRIVYKPLERKDGMIMFEAAARGGISLADSGYAKLQLYLNDLINLTREPLTQSMEKSISLETRRLAGLFHKSDSEEFFRKISEGFIVQEPDDRLFERYIGATGGEMEYAANSPEKIFSAISGRNTLIHNGSHIGSETSPMQTLPTLDEYHGMLEFANALYSNPAEFTFIFIGDIDQDLMNEMAERFLAPLRTAPVVRRKQENARLAFTTYNKAETTPVPMTFPRCLHSCKVTFPSNMRIEERTLAEVASRVIERRIHRELSLMGILVNSDVVFFRYPDETAMIDFRFSTYMEPAEIENKIAHIIMTLSQEGVSANEVDNIKKSILLNEQLDRREEFDYWRHILKIRYVNQKDFFTRKEDALSRIEKESVDNMLIEIIERGNITIHSVIPEKTDSIHHANE